MFFKKKPDPSPAKGKAVQSTPTVQTGIALFPTIITQFDDLGVRKVLTGSVDSIHEIPVDARGDICAIDKGDRSAWILLNAEIAGNPGERIKGIERQLIGALHTKGYRIDRKARVTKALMKELLQLAANQSTTSTADRGAPLELFHAWIDAAVRLKASDLHVLMWGNQCSTKVRVDGILEPLRIDGSTGIYSRTTGQSAVAAGFNFASRGSGSALSQYNESIAGDCVIEREVDGKSVLLRYQNIAAPAAGQDYGAKVVVRLLQSEATGVVGNFNDAGYAPSQVRLLKTSSRAGKGMVIVAGVTGSGKSTSLKIYIETLPDLEKKAIETVEDPIEYVIAPGKVHQGQVTRDLADPEETRRRFGIALKSLMRGDIDGVLVGEVRDDVSARFMLQVAETGHLAMCSLHAHLLSNIVPRLTNEEVGLTRQELTSPQIINLLVYQALVPLLCPDCCLDTEDALKEDQTGEVQDIVTSLDTRFQIDTSVLRWKNHKGCAHCNHRGTRGRTMVAEMYAPDRKWLELVREGKDFDALLHYRSTSDRDFASPDMNGKTVFEHTLYKALLGLVDVRNCEEFEGFDRYEFMPPIDVSDVQVLRKFQPQQKAIA